MLIGGLRKLTLIDYPGKIAATVFTVGCNFRCPFCHNPELVLPELIKKQPLISEEAFFKSLKSRQGKLDGICIGGGEPTLQKDLLQFTARIKELGFLVKLDTNGSNPLMLKKLIEQKLVDYLAMDIKSSAPNYKRAIGAVCNLTNIEKSIRLIQTSGRPYQFRTTVVPDLVNSADIKKIKSWLADKQELVLQEFRPEKTLNPRYQKKFP